MTADLAPLWAPARIGATEVRNRIFVSAHQTGYAGESGGIVGDRYLAYLRERVRGGAGLVITEVAAVFDSPRRLLAARPEIVPSWQRLAGAVHEHGGRVFAQLWHPGAHEIGDAGLDDMHASMAPSPVPSVFTGRTPREMDTGDIRRIVAAYAQAAHLAQEGGLDGAELHAGHGYLPCQFLSPLTNHRTDGYGGDVAGRCRLVLDIAEAVRERCGRDFTLGVRLSADEFVGDAGLTIERTEAVVAELAASGLFDFYDVSGGNYHSMHRMIPTAQSGLDGHLAVHAARVKAVAGPGAAVMVASGVRTVERAAAIVGAGQADLVAMTRAHIADPELVAKARAGRAGEIRRCVGANQGCLRRLYRFGTISCTVNPAAGREARLGRDALTPAPVRRHVVVAGGGPAGLAAAETAARRGHRVTLLEREGAVGGHLRMAGRLPGGERWLELARDLERSARRLGVDVRAGVPADAGAVRGLQPDAVVVATGSRFTRDGRSPARPRAEAIAGAGASHVLDPVAVIADPTRCGRNVVIADDVGDLLPLALALLLAEGRAVRVVSRHLFAGAGAGLQQTGDLASLGPRLEDAGVRIHAQAAVAEIEPGSVRVVSVWGRRSWTVVADTVVLNEPRRADNGLAAALRADGMEPIVVGDCLAPREVDDAMFEGTAAGAEI